MNPLTYLRWRFATRRAALGTIALIERHGGLPRSLVDAGARNSEFMRYLAAHWPNATVDSFELNPRCHPIGAFHCFRLGDQPGWRLLDMTFRSPALLKLDVDCAVDVVIRGIDFTPFRWVVHEVIEDGINSFGLRSNRSQLHRIMEAAGYHHSAAVDATICLRGNRVMQTDVLWWKSDNTPCPGCHLNPQHATPDPRHPTLDTSRL